MAGLLPVPVLLAPGRLGTTRGLWGATAIAAALIYAIADTLSSIPGPRVRSRRGTGP